MGAGGSQEASFALRESVPAGTYHFVLDAVIVAPVDVTFSLLWRHGQTDVALATWRVHYDPLPGASFDAQPFEYDEDAAAITWQSGDQLVFRYAGANTNSAEAYIPNGDGKYSHGRIPNIRLPR